MCSGRRERVGVSVVAVGDVDGFFDAGGCGDHHKATGPPTPGTVPNPTSPRKNTPLS